MSGAGAPKNLAVVGATGSVGGAVLDVCRRFPDRFRVRALSARTNREGMLSLIREFSPRCVHLWDGASAGRFSPLLGEGMEVFSGEAGLIRLVSDPRVDQVVFASSGTETIRALQAALDEGKEIALANKESIVVAGPWVLPRVRFADQIRPVDSEHSAVWQCLAGEDPGAVERIWLTASGGPFRDRPLETLATVRPEEALRHPTWSMGAKITVDSATLMNKGIECLEAMRLFGLSADRVGALIHPSSQAHAVVRYRDGSSKVLVSAPDMRLPAAAALSWPDRLPLQASGLAAPPPEVWDLRFSLPDPIRYPCFRLALEAARVEGAAPALLVASDEVAVSAFLGRRIAYTRIPRVVEAVLERGAPAPDSLEAVLDVLERGRRLAEEYLASGEDQP